MIDLRRGWQYRGQCGVLTLVAAILTAIGLVFPVGADTSQQREGSASTEGAALFKTYCASCHDAAGTGRGPAARALRQAPADLTEISKRNGGTFPSARVRRIIEGRDVESHGDRDMPVWGDAFKTSREGRTQESADARIAAIVEYLESIQHREVH